MLFCVIAQDLVAPEKYTTLFRSVIAFGQVRVLEDAGGKARRPGGLGERFNPGSRKAWKGNLQHMGQRVRAGDGD